MWPEGQCEREILLLEISLSNTLGLLLDMERELG